jgi:hypothetical protein
MSERELLDPTPPQLTRLLWSICSLHPGPVRRGWDFLPLCMRPSRFQAADREEVSPRGVVANRQTPKADHLFGAFFDK